MAGAFPEVRLLLNRENLGYAAGNNIGIRAARGRLLMLLNSDTEVRPGTLDRLAGFLERSLHCYLRQDYDDDHAEYIIIDDDSTDRTRHLCYDWARALDLIYVRLRKPAGVAWRGAARRPRSTWVSA